MKRDRRVLTLGALALIALTVWTAALAPRPATMQVTFFDVGDGLCTLIRTPSGKLLVVDCGTSSWRNSASVGKKLVVPYLQSLGANGVDALILSHPHSDHMSGIPGLLSAQPAAFVMDTGDRQPSKEYAEYVRAVRACHARYRKLRRGQQIDMGDGVTIHVIGPAPDSSDSNPNDRSTVLRVVFGRVAVMITADAGEDAEAEMIASGANLRAQVLQVGHHGSARSTTPQWLAAVKPSIAVISCASRSRYGFPSKRVLDRLNSFGARTYSTGRDGAVMVSTDGTSIQVETLKRSR